MKETKVSDDKILVPMTRRDLEMIVEILWPRRQSRTEEKALANRLMRAKNPKPKNRKLKN
jgi:hypothetical protein